MSPRNQTSDPIIGVLVSDIHLSTRPPLLRSREKDWFVAMRRTLKQVRTIAFEHDAFVVCAGDVFDKWYSSPELINFALHTLPHMYAVPGQHDLPYHDYTQLKRSAFYTLMKAGKLTMLKPGEPTYTDREDVILWGFPWGHKIKPLQKSLRHHRRIVNVAVLHDYMWIPGCSYDNAPEKALVENHKAFRMGYDVVHVGDNHKGFLAFENTTRVISAASKIFNAGTLMRRSRDDMKTEPMIGLLYRSGNVKRHYLDTSEDVYLDVNENRPITAEEMELGEFFKELQLLGKGGLDFASTLKEYIKRKGINKHIANIIYKAMGANSWRN